MDYPEFIECWRNHDDFVECHTSGSTGIPKLIRLPKLQMARSAERTISFFGLSDSSRLHSCISPDYIGGKMMAVRAEICGASLSWEKPSNRVLTAWSDDDISLLAVVPSQMIDLLNRLDELPRIEHIIIGGAPIPDSLRRQIAASGLDAWETYGMTETASHVALRKVADPAENFRKLDGIELRCGDSGQLIITLQGWQSIITNDVAEIAADGSFKILGRLDNVIITGGKKVHPEQVEAILEQALGVPVKVSGEPDYKWGTRVVLTVESKEVNKEEILALCRSLLPKECVPKEIRFDKVQITENGKKKRKKQA